MPGVAVYALAAFCGGDDMQEAKVWQMIGGGLTAAACVGGAIMVFDIGVRPQSLVALATDLALGFLFLAGVVGIAAGRVICFLGGRHHV